VASTRRRTGRAPGSAAVLALLVALVIALVTALAGCTYQRGGGARAAKAPQKGPVPTGAPLVLGFVTQEDSPTGSFPETRRAAQAAVAYVNEDLGGVEGRPLQLRTCRTDGSPEASQACARQLLAARPLAIIGGVDFGAGAALPAYQKAKVPYVSGTPQLLAELTDANSYALTGGTAAELLGTADYLIHTLHVHRVNALYVDLPGLLASAVASAKTIFDKEKIASRLVAEKADAADFTPALTSATADKPDAVVIVFPAASCQRILQAAAGLGTTVPLVVPGSCAIPRVLSAAGPTVPVLAASNYTLVPPTGGTPEEQAYRTRVAPADQAPIGQAAFSTVLDVRRLLVEAGTTPTSDALRRGLAASHEHASVMAHPYTCDRKQLPLVTAICNGFVRILSWRNGQLSDATGRWIDGKQTAKLLIGT